MVQQNIWCIREIFLASIALSYFSNSVDLKILIFLLRTDFYKWYHSQENSKNKRCENLLTAR